MVTRGEAGGGMGEIVDGIKDYSYHDENNKEIKIFFN